MPRAIIEQSVECANGAHYNLCFDKPSAIWSPFYCNCLCHSERKLKKMLRKNKVLASWPDGS